MDAAVLEQLLERHAGDLAADAVEAGEDHRVRRVVDDEVDAGEVLEGADVAALAADDAALHVVGRRAGRRETVVSAAWPAASRCMTTERMLRTRRSASRLVSSSTWRTTFAPVVADLVLELLEQLLARLRRGHAGDALELADVLLARVLELSESARASRRSRSPSSRQPALDRLLARAQALLEAQQVGTPLGALAVLGRRRRPARSARPRARRRRGRRRGAGARARSPGTRRVQQRAAATRPTASTTARNQDLHDVVLSPTGRRSCPGPALVFSIS